ncbi:hypothetical protein ABQX22_21990 [Xanthomonas sp. WHRI 1810A]|uniref:hypothetical protein n=1 Tax=Xanthomonas sp. WHRI 1810A TaxID=3161565 RepID=UPI0032E8A092
MPPLEAVHNTPLRPDAWAASNAHCRARYQVLADAEPDLLCRVLNLFAMQYLIPQKVSVLQQDGQLMIEAEVGELTWHRAQVIGEKMRSLISVCSVDLQSITDLHVLPTSLSSAAG